jgi:multiple sugar transport system permease protein
LSGLLATQLSNHPADHNADRADRRDFRYGFHITDLSVVYLLTRGGPMNGTQVLGSLAFQVGILSGDVAHGAVICLFLLPFLLIAVIVLLRALRQREI